MDDTDSQRTPNPTIRVIDGREILFDEEGFFIHPEDWTESTTATLASEMGMEELTGQQWKMIHFLRGYYMENGKAPLNRDIRRQTGLSLLRSNSFFRGVSGAGQDAWPGFPIQKVAKSEGNRG